ncbi:SDR family oxidoreductase [uncultured Tateyamaria sp.]|uniref:SDR family oxidoreductase n=1 Tax=uncultured Tateyamaria sp. TaxID=455651 RepID=UPI00262C7402|nr:SDR family oxidoreductase [uncultured Tateyamaria sp.]
MIKVNAPANNILVIGAYGLIGQGVSAKLILEGYNVTGLGRNVQTAQRVLPGVPWIKRDMRALVDDGAWHPILGGFSTVVNCSGALQDGPDDDLEALHHHAVAALAAACAAKDIALIQISAVGAGPEASTPFMASKGRGDAAIRAAGGRWHIFRPGLVLAPNAYGGTTMLRMLAAFPWVQPIAAPQAKIQTVSLDDVATAVVAATKGQIPDGFEADLVETPVHSLRDIVEQIRAWLGFRPALFDVTLPDFCVAAVSTLADGLSWFGWRSPLRSTALNVLTDGVRGTPVDLGGFGLAPVSSLDQSLSNMSVGVQDRLFARMALLAPIILVCLCLFWLTSGIVGIARVREAADVLENVGWPTGMAVASVLFWALVDIAIGIAFAFRKYAYAACWAAVGVSVFYLVASTFTVPSLWIDPLGPLVKVVPAIVLALVARAVLDTR